MIRVSGGDLIAKKKKSRMLDKIKKSLLKFPNKMKDVNNDDTVVAYAAFEVLHQFNEESVIGR